MDDKEYCDHNIIEMRNYLSNMLHSHICDHDISDLSAEEVGEVTDMIKDLAATERYSAQACYYKTVTKAMKEAEHPYRMGYIPDMDDYPPRYNRMNPRYPEYIYRNEEGYDDQDSKYPKSFNEYRKARKHFTETHSDSDRSVMQQKASESLNDILDTLKDLWNSSDPDLRKRMKDEMIRMINEAAQCIRST